MVKKLHNEENIDLDPKYKFHEFIISFLKIAVIVIFIALFNSNIIFLIRNAYNAKNILDKIFPSDCDAFPFGPQIAESKTTPICKRRYNTQVSFVNTSAFKENKLYDYLYNKDGVSGIWEKFDANDKINPFQSYLNWMLESMSETDTTVNFFIKQTLIASTNFKNRLLLVIIGLIIMVMVGSLILPILLYAINIIINQISKLQTKKIWTRYVIIFFTLFPIIFGFNPIYSIYETIITLLKLILLPMLIGGGKDVFNIMIENKDIIGFVLGLCYIWKAKEMLSDNISNILIVLYVVILLLYIFYCKFMHGIVTLTSMRRIKPFKFSFSNIFKHFYTDSICK